MTDTSRCPRCGGTGQIELQMRNKDGPTMTMLSCGRCENRTWLVDGEPMSREQVLAVVSGRPDFQLPPKR
jgi:hypothetical protein